MHNLANPSAILPRRDGLVPFCAEGSTGTEQVGLALVQEAATIFQNAWMPLDVCLTLWDWMASRSQESDCLATLFQKSCQKPERFRTVELQALIAPELLGGWALCVDTIDHLVETIQEVRPSAILEFGSGISSLALAWAMKRLYGVTSRPCLFSIDQSSLYIERTRELLSRHGLTDQVRFLQADLTRQTVGGLATRCYELSPSVLESFFVGARPDMVIIDGPAGENGVRFGTIPLVRDFMAPKAIVFLDDGLRDSELSTADLWSRLGYVRWKGIRWEGKGLLGGRICAPSPVPMQPWFEKAQTITGPRHRAVWLQFSGGSAHEKESEAPRPRYQVMHESTDRQISQPAPVPFPRQGSPTCVFLNTYYEAFLAQHYAAHPEMEARPYQEQHVSLQSTCFGDSDFYSYGLIKAGWEAVDLIVNCRPLQKSWAKEQGIGRDLQPLEVALEQIRALRPQVLYLQDLGIGTKEFFTAVRPHVEFVVGQIASPISPQAHLDGFHILISSIPHFVEAFRRQGRVAYYQPLAFDPRLLQRLDRHKRDFPLTFVGGLSPAHRERREFMTALTKSLPMHCWGYGTQMLTQQGVDAKRLHGDIWGLDMFSVLTRSAITINHHIDIARSNANNMRLFEATGCGALLVTDYKDNLSDLFDIGSEVVAYRSGDECVDLISYYLAHENEAAEIAKRGQERTLRDHTYEMRMRHTAELLSRHLERKSGANRLPDPDMNHISYGRIEIEPGQVSNELARSWRSDRIPLQQRTLVQHELEDLYRGNPPVVFRVLADALRPRIRPNIELLEVGCASGYYYEVLEYLLNVRLSYLGVDFSDSMIRLARSYYPHGRFEVGDGGALRFQDRSIPIVVSSCVLLHVCEYALHIAEAARVASEIVVFHRTPITRRSMTKYFKKFAYGVETFELRFNEVELLDLCRQAGLEIVSQHTYDSQPELDEFETTYVFRAGTERV